ncbi:copper homeostasis protein CutC [Nitratireductor kimnyeongensis]|uniref:PF03932 family protein CutC n=1 Tax=Nitratireductor kimnyeongensis TaxID=430679 RepID=A0ABW0T7H5_9HYPH|nr:copper homeostasis protein CutC [Nitratireductor kimnyeongensis]QZZ36200.1 copper homeostasis protein CutC [Nitratireductor kimnyeongensis]
MQATLEVCVDTVDGVEACVEGGADRIELCSALPLGGLTPSHGLMRAAAKCGVPAYAMIRPRQGDFCFNMREVALMHDDILAAREAGLAGVVLGAATVEGVLDEKALEILSEASVGMGRTLHRVIDTVEDRLEAINLAVAFGFERILTSGGAPTVREGQNALAAMRVHAGDRIEIMAGSGLTAENLGEIARSTHLRSFHASCSVPVELDHKISGFGFSSKAERQTSAQRIRDMKGVLKDLELAERSRK